MALCRWCQDSFKVDSGSFDRDQLSQCNFAVPLLVLPRFVQDVSKTEPKFATIRGVGQVKQGAAFELNSCEDSRLDTAGGEPKIQKLLVRFLHGRYRVE